MNKKKILQSLKDVADLKVSPDRLFSASHEEIATGATSDIYFIRSMEILNELDLAGTVVTAELFASRDGVMAGTAEIKHLLKDSNVKVEALPEGKEFQKKQTIARVKGPYNEFGVFETALLGILASSSAWAAAARECKRATGGKSLICFGARHLHPAVAPAMERAAVVGGADGASCILGAKLVGLDPMGTVPHAVFLIVGDTVKVAKTYDQIMPPDAARIILVDTFKDEVEEALRVAGALKGNLQGIRLDTPSERGGVTSALVRETRARLDQAGFEHVQILVSGGLTPERIRELSASGADAFGVGSYISGARPIDMTMDIKKIYDKPVAKRGRIPGLTQTPDLETI
ncbi:MAG TPA: nicotinate phosphoribosyltransferase [Clostridia bacterium]|nr:nicotinate phosphoribosyltransferase [Clostridia bacterium]